MPTTLIVKKGAGTPSPESLKEAELALDVVDGALYSKLGDGEIHRLNDSSDSGDSGNIEGGNASSVYTSSQFIDGGSA